MSQEWGLLLVMLGVLLVLSVVAVLYNLRHASRVLLQFRRLAERFGLELIEAPRTMGGLFRRPPALWGHYRGREMSLQAKGHGLDNMRQTEIVVGIVTRAPSDLRFTLARRSLVARLGQVGRLDPCETGDAAFDARFSLKASNPGAVLRMFGTDVRQTLLSVWSADTGFLMLKDGTLTYEKFGLPQQDEDSDHVALIAEFCHELAADLDTLSA